MNAIEAGVLDAIEGATIVSAGIDVDGEGLHLNLADGRVLIISGVFILGLMQLSTEKLH